jgi:oxysterol-binding protein-related protein 8
VYITGELRPQASFLGNSAGTTMAGGSTLYLGKHRYSLTNPTVYARSILIGKMFMELGDACDLKALDGEIECHLDFKTKVRTKF